MSKIEIKLELKNSEDTIDGYDLGHITIRKDQKCISSKTKNSNIDTSIMIFISIAEFLGSVSVLFSTDEKNITFIGIDTTFEFVVKRQKDNMIIIEGQKGELIDQVTQEEFINSLWKEVKNFYDSYVYDLDDEIIKPAMIHSLNLFKEEFSLD